MKTAFTRSSERGASAVMVAMSLLVLIGGAALAVDIGALWLDRSTDQKITDSAAAAGALQALESSGQEACETALEYVAANAGDIASVDVSGCAAAFPGSCTSGEFHEVEVNSGQYKITVTYPVEDADPLMTSAQVGAGTQPLHDDDGDRCERVAVEVTAVRDSLFAQLLGFDQGSTTVHTVATATTGEGDPPINLLVLDRHGCQAIYARGNGGIIVEAVLDTDDDGNPIGVAQGLAAADSDGTGALCGSSGVIALEGSNADIRADGPEDCGFGLGDTYPVGAYTAEEGCGAVQTFAPNSGGCDPVVNLPACSPGAGGSNPPDPDPTPLARPHTREKVDHRFNCYDDYDWSSGLPGNVSWATEALTVSNEQDIDDCEEADGTNDHIYNLIDLVGPGPGTPSEPGWDTWSSLGLPLSDPCEAEPDPMPITHTGNVVIDCANFEVKRDVTINGNVVFNGDVTITSGTGHLTINNTLGAPGWVFFRNGALTKDAQASLTVNYSMTYMSKTSSIALSGGNTGNLTWIAPDSGRFDDLALWSDSPAPHGWAGQSNLQMEGVFFMPLAKMIYTGSSGMNQTDAQWIADRLEAGGGGALVVQPAVGRSVSFSGPRTILIR